MIKTPVIVDDIFLRLLGISIPPFDMIWLFEQIQDFVFREAYDPQRIVDAMKENSVLRDLGEITEEEHDRVNAELMEKLKVAQRIKEVNLERRVDILNIG